MPCLRGFIAIKSTEQSRSLHLHHSIPDTNACLNFGFAVSISIFFRKVAMKTRSDATSFSHALPQIALVIKVCVSTLPIFFASKHNNLYSIGVKCNSLSFMNAHPAAYSILRSPFPSSTMLIFLSLTCKKTRTTVKFNL